jgi:outer membrane protein insertion porin family
MFKRFGPSLIVLFMATSFGFWAANAQTAPPPPPQPAQPAPAQPAPAQPTRAQPATPGPIDEIVVQGADSALELQGLIKVSVNLSVGDPIEGVKADEVKQQVLELGYFKSVVVETRTQDGKRQVVIRVELNPRIAEVAFRGNNVLPGDRLKTFLDQQFNIASGTIVNNTKLEEGRNGLAQGYRQLLPFTPKITLEQTPNADGTVKITYVIDESAAIKSVEVTGATLVPTKDIEAAFAALVQKGTFDAQGYVTALNAVGAAYQKLGYRGSGVNTETTELADGKLTVVVTELKVVAIDATALGLDPGQLSVKVGDFFNYDKLLNDLQGLSKNRDKQVQLKVEQVSKESVAVTIIFGDAPTGPIKQIKFTGNTVLSSEQLSKLLRQKVGDTYNAQIANEIDYAAIAAAYDTAGYLIVSQPRVNYTDGVYTVTVLEQKVVGYEIQWRGEHRTQDDVITREFPAPGGLFFRPGLQRSFGRVQQLGLLRDLRLNGRVPNPDKPEEVILILELEEGQTGSFNPSIGYNSLTGFEGTLGYRETNLWGLNHGVNVQIQANPNDAGQVVSANAGYTIPWLYVDFLDFKTVPTALNFSIFTSLTGSGQVLKPQPTPPANDKPNTTVNEGTESRKFTTRNTGFGLGVSRPIGDNFTIGLNISLNYTANYLETRGGYEYTEAEQTAARALVPVNSTALITALNGTYSTKNRLDFPTSGVVASATIAYGVGSQGTIGLSWTKYTLGFRTYVGFGFDENDQFVFGEDRNIALAARFGVGTILGVAPSSQQFSLGDVPTNNEDFALRGYSFGDLKGDVFYSGSLELRFDLGLKTSFTYGALAMVYFDFGNAWGNGSRATRTDANGNVIASIPAGLQFGVGLGVQINLGFGALQLPPIGLFYSFSPWNPSGKFSLSFGFRF